MLIVKIAKLGSKVVEVALADNATLAQALGLAEMDAEGFEPRVNGRPATDATVLANGDIVTLVPKIKGGQLLVKVAKLGARVVELYVPDGTTVGQAIVQAEFDAEGFEVRVNGTPARDADELSDGAIVTLVPKIKGGRS